MIKKNAKRAGVAGLVLTGLVFVACSDEKAFSSADGSGGSAGSAGSTNQAGADSGSGGAGGTPATGGAINSGGDNGSGGANLGGDNGSGGSSTGGSNTGGGGPTEVVLLDESFAANTASWAFVDPEPTQVASTGAASDWNYDNVGYLTQLTNYAGCVTGDEPICAPGSAEPGLAISLAAGSSEWTDYTVTATFVTFDDDTVGVIARYVDEDNYLLFEASLQDQYVRIRAIQNGVWTTLIEDLTPKQNYVESTNTAQVNELTLTVVGTQYTASVNGVQVLTTTDGSSEAPEAGGVALGSLSSEDVRFDSVRVVAE